MEKIDYKPNSYKFREEQKKASEPAKETKPIEVQKVIQGPVTIKKKTGARRLISMLLADDLPKVKDYVVNDVLWPSLKRALDEIITNGSHMMIWGADARSRNNNMPGSSVSYKYKDYTSYSKAPSQPQESRAERSGFDYEDIVFDYRGDAEMVITQMQDILKRYGIVRITNLYELIGKKNDNYCVYNYGWTNLDNAKVVRVATGYVLQLPKPYTID